MELKPFNEKKPNAVRERFLSKKEFLELCQQDMFDLWEAYDDLDHKGLYAPNVPHAAIITPNGIIKPKYLSTLSVFASVEQAVKIFLKFAIGNSLDFYVLDKESIQEVKLATVFKKLQECIDRANKLYLTQQEYIEKRERYINEEIDINEIENAASWYSTTHYGMVFDLKELGDKLLNLVNLLGLADLSNRKLKEFAEYLGKIMDQIPEDKLHKTFEENRWFLDSRPNIYPIFRNLEALANSNFQKAAETYAAKNSEVLWEKDDYLENLLSYLDELFLAARQFLKDYLGCFEHLKIDVSSYQNSLMKGLENDVKEIRTLIEEKLAEYEASLDLQKLLKETVDQDDKEDEELLDLARKGLYE